MGREYPHLNHPPIREALLDMQVDPGPEPGLAAMEAFARRVEREFPTARPIYWAEARFEVQNGEFGATASPRQDRGRIAWSHDNSRGVQARIDGFTVNQVGSYSDWAALRDLARRVWPEYVATAHPRIVKRCALRFINRIEVADKADLGEYVRTKPTVAQRLPQQLDAYFMRVQIPCGGSRSVTMTHATELGAPGDTSRGLLFDVDASSTRTFAPDDRAIWDEFEVLRELKNQAFFESLTEKALEPYR